jgi:hypothetical protein
MATTYLPPEHHVIRYVPWARLRRDENEQVIGDNEEYLSATWLEYFPAASRQQMIIDAVHCIRASKIDVRPRSGFAIGQVQKIQARCLADPKAYKIRVVHEPEDDNPAHTALRRWPENNDQLLELLALDEWSETLLNSSIP